MIKLLPLYLWQVIHYVPSEQEETRHANETIHYLVLPSNNYDFVVNTLGVGFWEIQGHLPEMISCMDQVSNLTCCSYSENDSPVDVQSLDFYNPNSDEYRCFVRNF